MKNIFRPVLKSNQNGFAFLPVIIVFAVLALLGGGSATLYNIEKHNQDENEHLRSELAELKQATPSPSLEVTDTPQPTIVPKPSLSPKPKPKVQGISTVDSVAIKATVTPTPTPTKQPTPLPVVASPVPTPKSAAVSIEMCKTTAKKAINDVKDEAMQKSPGVSILANAVSLGDAEQVALKYGYYSQSSHDQFQEYISDSSKSVADKQGMIEAHFADMANLQKWAVKKIAEIDSILEKEENEIYQKCLNSL